MALSARPHPLSHPKAGRGPQAEAVPRGSARNELNCSVLVHPEALPLLDRLRPVLRDPQASARLLALLDGRPAEPAPAAATGGTPDTKDLVLRELRHRLKNVLALIYALARQTRVDGRSGAEYREAFLGRLAALERATDLNFEERGSQDLHALIRSTLEPYDNDHTVIAVEPGTKVVLSAERVMALSLILHELATNAVKYGALSVRGGGIQIQWTVAEEPDGRFLQLLWRELGGPPAEPPRSRGFGTRLITFASAHQLGRAAELDFAPDGLRALISARLG